MESAGRGMALHDCFHRLVRILRAIPLAVAGPLAVVGCGLMPGTSQADQAEPAAQPAPPPAPAELTLGVISHFGSSWPLPLMSAIERVEAPLVRQAIAWRAVEAPAGRYRLDSQPVRTVESLCARGKRVLLLLEPRHHLYDRGQTAFTPAARTAFGRFAAALADRLAGCVVALEIGNEINGAGGMTGAAAANRPRAHVELLRAVWTAVKPDHPDMLILGGATHSVATGFLEEVFAAGGLDVLDAVAVHPYRRQADNLDWELARLHQAMVARGRVRPIWATEFGLPTDDDTVEADYLLQMAGMLSAAGVPVATWYALLDDRAFPNMGLLTATGAPKPEAAAFALAGELLAKGPARRVDAGSGVVHLRFGDDTHLLWGAPRMLVVPGAARARDSQGREIATPARLSAAPVVIDRAANVILAGPAIYADSLTDYAVAPWSYAAMRPGTAATPFAVRDWTWTSYLGTALNAVTAVNQHQIVLGGAGKTATSVRLRYVADRPGNLWMSGCVARPRAGGDGAIVSVHVAGTRRLSQPLTAAPEAFAVAARVERGDTVDFLFEPKANTAADILDYQLRIAADARANVAC